MAKRTVKRGLICKGKRTTLQRGDSICFNFASCNLSLQRKGASLRVFRDSYSFGIMRGLDRVEAQTIAFIIAVSHGFDLVETEYTGPTVTFMFE